MTISMRKAGKVKNTWNFLTDGATREQYQATFTTITEINSSDNCGRASPEMHQVACLPAWVA
eukprot:scaffold606692_cov48-Prasinocladus_malaysianus.AAC.2